MKPVAGIAVLIVTALAPNYLESGSVRCPSFGAVQENIARTLTGAAPEARARARAWVRDFQNEADELAQRGRVTALLHKDLRAIVVSFDDLGIPDLPFPGASVEEQVRETYRALGRLSGPDYSGVENLPGRIGHLVARDASNKKGALLELRAASDLVDQGVDRSLLAFEREIFVPETGVTRKPDVLVKDSPGSTNLRGALHRECKNWPDGLQGQGANFSFLREYVDDEFPSDIFMHAQDGFARYNVDLREVLRQRSVGPLTEADIVRDELLKKFSDPFIVNGLGGPTAAANARTAFELAWNAGRIPHFY